MSASSILTQPATIPEGVQSLRTFPDATGRLEASAHVNKREPQVAVYERDGVTRYEIDPRRPTPRFVGRPWLDFDGEIVTFVGLYVITHTRDGAGEGVLQSEFACTAYPSEQCSGHTASRDGGVEDPYQHFGPDRDLVSLMGEHSVWEADVFDHDSHRLQVTFEEATIETDGEGLVRLADELEVLVALLRKRAFEILPEDPESVPLDHVDEGHDEMEPPC
jgi:hypothetical protein